MKRVLAAAILAAAVAWPAAAAPFRTDNIETELHSARAAIAPGERFTIALRQTINEGWHTYWRNPGDSGDRTKLDWRLPSGFAVGDIQWPAPEALPFDVLVNHGYSGEVLFPIEVTAPASLRPGQNVTLTADAEWLICSDICIPEEGTLSLTLPVAAQGRDDPQWAARIAEAVAALPKREPGVEARIGAGGALSVSLPGAEAIRNPHFFAFDRDAVRANEAQRPRVGPEGLSFTLAAGLSDNLGQAPLGGVVTYEAREGEAWARRAVEIEALPGAAITGTDARPADISPDFSLAALEGVRPPAAPDAPPLTGLGFLAVLGFAFIGGLILNIMPCVLPVLSVKALSFAGGAHAGQARRHGALYLAGVMATFLLLAGVLIGLRGAGAAVGWGFQLQAPWMSAGLSLLFFAIGLNLLGVFNIGQSLQGVGSGLAARNGDAGAFFTGALAVVAATPCTAPFMATAIGAALTQSSLATLGVFAALGLGFAAPFTALSFAPGLQRLMPKPGPWMERVKNVLAFPMFGAAVWLAWVLAEQAGPMGVLSLLSLAAALSFLLFVGRWGKLWTAAGVAALLITGAATWRPLAGVDSYAALTAEAWSPQRVEQLRAEGRPIFVNFTAAWCVTCKVNEATSLTRPRVAEAFRRTGVAYLKADWTNRNETIAAALAEHGRAGVPLYLYYPASGAPPVVLPQVLSEALILDTIAQDRP